MSPTLPEPGPRDAPPLRIFFALWPDAGARDALSALARDTAAQARGRAPSAGNLHLTLAFLGDVAAARIAALHAIGPAVASAVPPFTLTLDRVGAFGDGRNSMGGRLRTATRARAAGAVADRRAGQGRVPDRTAGLPPACDAGAALPAPRRHGTIAAIAWRVERITLNASELSPRGPRYRELGAWPLGSRGSRRHNVLVPH